MKEENEDVDNESTCLPPLKPTKIDSRQVTRQDKEENDNVELLN